MKRVETVINHTPGEDIIQNKLFGLDYKRSVNFGAWEKIGTITSAMNGVCILTYTDGKTEEVRFKNKGVYPFVKKMLKKEKKQIEKSLKNKSI